MATLETLCVFCKREVGNAHKCILCDEFVHVFCGEGNEEEEGYGQAIKCFVCLGKKSPGHKTMNEQNSDNDDVVIKEKKGKVKINISFFQIMLCFFWFFLLEIKVHFFLLLTFFVK